jgi:hypothetical protein
MKKGQAAMEFLMTYGWAILVVLAAIGALAYFGVLSPNSMLPERTTFQAPLAAIDNALIDATQTDVTISFKNNKGSSIYLSDNDGAATAGPLATSGASDDCIAPNPALTGRCVEGCGATPVAIDFANDNGLVAGDTEIPNGATFTLTFPCTGTANAGDRFDADLTFYYYTEDSGIVRPHSGQVQGKVTN